MGCKYVKDFKFSPDFGFSGSAGKTMVKPHMRMKKGGQVKKPPQESCSCHAKKMAAGGLTKSENKLIAQVADQTRRTGRVPGIPAHSNKPLIRPR